MKSFSLSHLADHLLSRELTTLVAQDWAATARLLACLAEFDERKLYLPAGHPSMFAYCVRELRMSEDMAFKRIRAARAARAFPAIFPALAEGRLHLSGVVLLSPHLSPGTAESLLAAAKHKSKAEIELLLAERFPQPDVPTLVRALAVQVVPAQLEPAVRAEAAPAVPAMAGPAVRAEAAPAVPAMAGPAVRAEGASAVPALADLAARAMGAPAGPATAWPAALALAASAVRVVSEAPGHGSGSLLAGNLELAIGQGDACAAPAPCESLHEVAPGPVVQTQTSPAATLAIQVRTPDPTRPKLAPLSPGRFALQVTVDQETYEQLRYAQALLGHAVPSGDVAQLLKRALNALVEQLERQKLAKASRTRPRRGAANGRHIPAEVRRAVWQRDGGQCTFVSDKGHRCEARMRLEFDHFQPVARGGLATVANLRLRCRAHNQYAAECAFGAGFMREKREMARHLAADKRARGEARAPARPRAGCEAHAQAMPHLRAREAPAVPSEKDVIPWLRQLGYCLEQARRGAASVAHIPDASLEERVKLALRGLAPASVRRIAPAAGAPA